MTDPAHLQPSHAEGATWTIRPCAIADAPMLSELGARLFVQTYGPTHPEPELTPYLQRSFDVAVLARMLAEPGVCVLVVESEDGRPMGYALLRVSSDVTMTDLPEWARARRPIEIGRFYVDAPWHGRGVAPQLMAACVQEAERRGAGVLWLAVWQEAPRPQRFYTRMGFRAVGTTTFCFGTRIDHDHVMVRELTPTPRGMASYP